jgi:hypothetical protein
MGTLGKIVWDGVKAFLFWLVASMLMIYFWGYPGLMLSRLLGLIFVVAFFALRFTEILAFVLSLGRRQRNPSNTPPPVTPPGSAPPLPAEPTYCPKCGSAWVPGARACANCG